MLKSLKVYNGLPFLSMRKRTSVDHGMSTHRILNHSLDAFKRNLNSDSEGAHLDIGVGTGTLTKLVRSYAPKLQSYGVDYTKDNLKDPEVELHIVDLDEAGLPFADNKFDFVSCIEVLEHLENFRATVREAFRVLKPGSTAVFTTPNVLSLNSRIRYFLIGFPKLFSPIQAISREVKFSTNGHITPVSFFFLSHAMTEAGFKDIDLKVDKYQRSAILPMLLFYPLIKFFSLLPIYHENRKSNLDDNNIEFFNCTNSLDMLMGRTIIVSAKKPSVL